MRPSFTTSSPSSPTKKVSDKSLRAEQKVFNDQQIVDLTAVAGNYVMVAMLLAMAEETVLRQQGRAEAGEK